MTKVKIGLCVLVGLYFAIGILNMFMLGSSPLIVTEPLWALVLLWPIYWWLGI